MRNVGLVLLVFGCIVGFAGFAMMLGLENGTVRGTNMFASVMYVGQFVGGAFALLGLLLAVFAPSAPEAVK